MPNQQGTSSTDPTTFIKGMIKDVDDGYFPEGSWFHLRNGVNNSKEGNDGTIGNEPSNTFCQAAPYTIIGTIHLNADRWVIYSTDNSNSEIGLFLEDSCTYTRIANDIGNTCLNFNTNNLIIGVAKENFDCTWQTYWADVRNPDRTMNIDKPPFTEICNNVNNCLICTPTTILDCDKLRLAPLVTLPCLGLSRGPNGGSILNGSYYVVAAYVLNSQVVTDYFMPSNTQAIFEHDNASGSLLITINQMDTAHFDYFELVLVRTVNSQTSAKKIGIYSTRQAQISIDSINEALESVPVELIPLRTPSYERSDGVFEIGNYMLRTGPRAKFDFNYQPLANRIITKWQAVAYPSNYYAKGGNRTTYLRDEVYPFFIRWIYDTADRSSSYHIPGRPARLASVSNPVLPAVIETAPAVGNSLDPSDKLFEAYNTATPPTPLAITLADGGVLFAEGEMAYWESTELYPDKKPNIFNASSQPFSALGAPVYTGTAIIQYDLCGNPIRHHKFPDNEIIPHFRPDPSNALNQQIVLLGVDFDNILPPVDNNGVLIPGIVGYEILRGSREGNKTVIAKGILNNMRTYTLDNGQTGLYQNYPYNSLGPDPSLAYPENLGESPINPDHGPLAGVSTNQFTFHSPDTSFNNPFLSSKELKLYGELYGNVIGSFDESPKHPKEKLLTDIAFVTAALVGIGAAMVAIKGRKSDNYTRPVTDKNANHGLQTVPGAGFWGVNDAVGTGLLTAQQAITQAAILAATTPFNAAENTIANLLGMIPTGTDFALQTYRTALNTVGLSPTATNPQRIDMTEASDYSYLPPLAKFFGGFTLFSNYWTLGTEAAMDLIRAVVPYTQYAMRYTSHGFLNTYAIGADSKATSTFRYNLSNAIYLGDGFQEFGENSNAKINNVNRGKTVALQTINSVQNPSTIVDNSTQTIGSANSAGLLPGFSAKDVKNQFTTNSISHYAALKNRMRNQYGQLDGIIQVPVSTCLVTATQPLVAGTTVLPTGPLFNGDTYIGRYTEKNTFFYFWDWLYGQPDGFEFDYKLRYMLNFPRYWANFEKYDPGEFLQGIVNFVTSGFTGSLGLPSNRHKLDGPLASTTSLASFLIAIFRVTERYFYLFQSGIRDFYVESEINVDLRDWDDPISKRYYDPYRFTDVRALFEPSIIKSGNFFKYDQSLSVSRVFNNFFSWGNVQDRDYDPNTAATCFTYYKKRVIYSLPQNLEAKKDFWRVFLANNYKDFKSRVIAVEPVNKNGAMFFFEEEAPMQFQGVDTLQTDLGTKITIGDGGLFSQPQQSVVNANESYEYGSCQNRLSVANTPVGLFWISENQGKIFRYTGQIKELSAINMKFWFSRYLPYQLLLDFPTFQLTDNPVDGIGCQSVFNNRDTIMYFSKKDFSLRKDITATVTYVSGNTFLAQEPNLPAISIKLGDPLYFEDASWTLSFDPKDEAWQSFHDWHPDLLMPSKTHHLTIVKNLTNGTGEIWKHTDSQLSFCKFYGIDYPWEVDYVAQTGQIVNTMRSIEYFMEAHIYNNDESDFYHVLDYNFDHSIIYNSEQVSGVLILNLNPKNDIVKALQYPIVNPTSIDILFDKVEQKYRFNQFWDVTADRGEFTFPTVQRQIWRTQSNGYIRTLNPNNLNYNKSPLQRKKFRHFANHTVLTRNINNNIKMLLKLSNNKNLVSLR